MAEPISNIKPFVVSEETKQKKDLNEIEAAIADNKEAMLSAITLTRYLHDNGLLQIMNGMLSQGEEVLDIAVKEINRPQNSTVLENSVGLALLLGSLDVDHLKILTEKLNRGLEKATSEEDVEGPNNVFQLMKSLKDPEISRSLGMLMNFLKGMGKEE